MAILVNCGGCGKRFRAKDQFRNTRSKCPNCKAAVVVTGPHVCGTDVFISHSTPDKQVADAVCAAMEGRNLKCWIAPRDIPPGASWGAAIIEGIEDSRVMLLVFSEQTNKSDQVLREVERAVGKRKPIVPLRLDATPMRKDYEYFLASCHWLDATNGALEDHLATLTGTVRHLVLDRAGDEADLRATAATDATTTTAPGPVAPAIPAPRAKSTRLGAMAASLVLAAALIAAAVYVKRQPATSAGVPQTQTVPAPPAPATMTPTSTTETPGGEPVDLLARLRIPEDVVSGDWKRTPEGVHVSGPAPGRATFGPPPPGDYDLHLTFTSFIGDDGVGIVLSRFGNNFALALGTKTPPGYGFGFDDGKVGKRSVSRRRHSRRLENDMKHELVVRVRRHGASATLDGEPLADLVTRDYHELSIPRQWAIGRNSLGLVTYRTVMIHSAECRPVKEGAADPKP